ncbi:MAG: single-stranded-DNA-specific exonuclease RecJ, partial [Eubacteriales bacterium]|nr:single-stranded-DNA-specific exonuclease RecJ [Eubacteriales bacterium]
MNGIHPMIREILKHRGVTEEADILEFLSEKPSLTYDPFLLKNLEAGVDFLLSAIKQNKKICIYGDYDADGVTSISLLMEILSNLTENLTYYIPSRFDEGYGLNKDAIELLRSQGTDLILTVDCGSVSYEEVEYGKSLGIDFIITDHHNINDKPADCILINPKQADCSYPFKHLAGCGVAFKLAQGIQRKAGLPKSLLNGVLDLVAIATIGDIVPLIDENRTLTKYGMGIINARRRPGLDRLIKETGLTTEKIKSENIAYIIVPHLNAAGRLLDAKIGVELLLARDEKKITENVAVLIDNNKERKRIQEEAFHKCKEVIATEHSRDLFYIIAPKGIHEGIAGIVAGKIKDEYGRPAIIVTESADGCLKGT